MISTSKKGVNRLWCDGCNRRIASASKMEKLIAKADAAGAERDELDLCIDCAKDPIATYARKVRREKMQHALGWVS